MIKDIRSVPVFRLFSALLIGILLKNYLNIKPMIILVLIIFFIGISGIIIFFKLIRKPSQEWINGLCILTGYMFIGLLIHNLSDSNVQFSPNNSEGIFVARIIENPLHREKSFRTEAEILKCHFIEDSMQDNIRILVYFRETDKAVLPSRSEIIIFRGSMLVPESPQNPGEFDYADYLKKHKIQFTCFLRAGEWSILGRDHKFSFMGLGSDIREKIWKKISGVQPENTNPGILYALGLGSRELLDKETKEAFISSGTMHILAVSGLHVGLIYLIITRILSFLRRIPSGDLIFFLMVVLLIWLYALVTGMSPSVVRSAIMFSFFNIGKIIKRETSVYNVVFLSAFFTLFFVPAWIYEAGFQLSYSAVLAIIFFHPRIVSFFSFRIRIAQWFWELIAVSIAAQIGTVSISLFYFHRFPPYFLIANIIVIPLVTLILFVFVFQILSMFIPFLFILISKVNFFLISLLDFLVNGFQQLPSPQMNNIYFEFPQLCMLILIVLSIAFYIRYHHNYWIIITLACLTLFLFSDNIRIMRRNHSRHLVVYKLSQDFVIGLYDSGKGIILVETKDQKNLEDRLEYKCSGFHRKHSIYRVETKFFNELDNYESDMLCPIKLPGAQNYVFWFMNKKIIILTDPGFYIQQRTINPVETDILIINVNALIKKEAVFKYFTGKTIILSGAEPSFKQMNYDEDTYYDNLTPVINTCYEGAWVCSFTSGNQLIVFIEKYRKSLGNLLFNMLF